MRLVLSLCLLTAAVSALSSESAEVRDAERALKQAEKRQSDDLPALFLRGEEDLLDVLEDPTESEREMPVEELRETLQEVLGKENQENHELAKKGWNEEAEISELKKALGDFKAISHHQSVEEILEDPEQSKKSALDDDAKAGLHNKKDFSGSKQGSKEHLEIVKREREIMTLLEQHIRREENMMLTEEDEERKEIEHYLLNNLKQRLEEEPKNLELMVSADPEGLYEKEERFLEMLKEAQDRYENGREDDGSGEEPFIPPALFKDLCKALGKLFAQSFLFFRDEGRISALRDDLPRDKRDLHPFQIVEEAAGEDDNLQEMLGEEGLQMSEGDLSSSISGRPVNVRDDETEALQLALQIREVLQKKSPGSVQQNPVEEIEERGILANVLSEVLNLARELPDPSDVTMQDEQLTSQLVSDDGNVAASVLKIQEDKKDGGNQALEILYGLNQAVQADDNLQGLFDKISGELQRSENVRMDDKNLVQFVGHSLEEDSKDDVAQDVEGSVLSEDPGDQEAAGLDLDWFGNSLEVVKKTVSMLGKSDQDGGIVKRDVSEVREEDDNRDTIVAESLRVYQMYLTDQNDTPRESKDVCRRTFSPCQTDADCCAGSCHRFVHKSQIMPYCG